MNNLCRSELLLSYIRDNQIEQRHFGNIVVIDKFGNIIKQVGSESQNLLIFHRSCAKPLFTSILIDTQTDKFFNFNLKHIAISCASHCGQDFHIEVLKDMLKLINLDQSYLKCLAQKPISEKTAQRLISTKQKYTKLHNNCSGKHIMMLSVCKHLGLDLKSYDDINHDLQKMIYNNMKKICGIDENQSLPITRDGCGLPIWATTLQQLAYGFVNIFLDKKYYIIKQAFIQYPKLIGGDFRLDSEVMKQNKNLILKVGATGLVVIVNLEKEQAMAIKMDTCDIKARSLVTIFALHQINWLNQNHKDKLFLCDYFSNIIKTETKKQVGYIKSEFSLN